MKAALDLQGPTPTPADPQLRAFGENYLGSLRDFVYAGRAELRVVNGDGFCVSAAYLTTRILQRRSLKARTLRVDAFAMNATALAAYRSADRMLTAEELADTAPDGWTVGVAGENFHAVVIVEGSRLYDPTAGQLSRPTKLVEVPAPLIAEWDGEQAACGLPLGGAIWYGRARDQRLPMPNVLTRHGERRVRDFVKHWASAVAP